MSLVLAFTGSKEAIIGGDRRSIDFFGKCPALEDELYSGKIRTDDELKSRARETCSSIQVSDGKDKVWRRNDILVGEVTESSAEHTRSRRIYTLPGAYVMVDVADGQAKISGTGRSTVLVLGNVITKKIAADLVQNAKGRIDEGLFRAVFEEASRRTASVSADFSVLSTRAIYPDPESALIRALEEDCQKSGWKLCAQQ
ncbi:MAG TPA: DUF2121 domain-containing protein [Methanotrichaceae archaeon]|nr:DUF2121 domain-containing protein [Methanotrichaceae archaeon]